MSSQHDNLRKRFEDLDERKRKLIRHSEDLERIAVELFRFASDCELSSDDVAQLSDTYKKLMALNVDLFEPDAALNPPMSCMYMPEKFKHPFFYEPYQLKILWR